MTSRDLLNKLQRLDSSIRAAVKKEGESVTDFMTLADVVSDDEKIKVITDLRSLLAYVEAIRIGCTNHYLSPVNIAALETIARVVELWKENPDTMTATLVYKGGTLTTSQFYQLNVMLIGSHERLISCKVNLE